MASIERRGNSFRIVVSHGLNIAGGQIRYRKTIEYNPALSEKQNRKEAERQAVLFEEEIKRTGGNNGNIRLADFIEIWRSDYATNNLKPKVMADYEQLLPRLVKSIGHIKLKDIKAKTLNDFYKLLSEKGIGSRFSYKPKRIVLDRIEKYKAKNGTYLKLSKKAGISLSTLEAVRKNKCIEEEKAAGLCDALRLNIEDAFTKKTIRQKLSSSTIQHYHRLISSILGKAVRWEYIERNPALNCNPPKVEKGKKEMPDYEQAIALANNLEDEDIKHKTMILLLLYSGMRKGELLGLEWKDIDFDTCSISIERASQYVRHQGIVTVTPKTKSSIRMIKLPQIVFDLLKKYRVWQSQERLLLGSMWHDSDRLFTAWDGKPMHPSSINRWFTDFLNRKGLPHITVHDLRHINASIMIKNHIPITTVSNRLGHAQTSTTLNIYSHAIASADMEASNSIGDYLSQAN